MKTLKLVALGMFLFVSSLTQAQVSISVTIGSPPSWGPAGYSNVEFYYLPDIEVYYDIRASQFIFFSGGKWIRSRYLPAQHRNYNLYKGYKVVLRDYHGSRPFSNFKIHKQKYYRGYKAGPQRTIGRGQEMNRKNDNRSYNNRNEGQKNKDRENRGRGKDRN
jgi:hypothetical protein